MRQLLIGDGTTSAIANGVEAAGAIGIEKLSETGPTNLVPGDTISDTTQIRFVQGTADMDIYTPWITGKQILSYDGKSYTAQAAQVSTLTWSADATNTSDIDVTVKIVERNTIGNSAEIKSYTVTTNTTGSNIIATQAAIGDNFTELFYNGYDLAGSASLSATSSEQLPDCVKTVTWNGSTVITLTGWEAGETHRKGHIVEYPTAFDVFVEHGTAAADGGTVAAATGTSPTPGSGDGAFIRSFEESLQGSGAGYYNRIHLPKAPNSGSLYGVLASNYDTYSIVCTKDGSTSPQIKGVDNLIEIYIAMPAGDPDGLIFEGKLNPWMNSAGFGSVNL